MNDLCAFKQNQDDRKQEAGQDLQNYCDQGDERQVVCLFKIQNDKKISNPE